MQIHMFPWVQNGLWDLELSTIDEFGSIAEADPKALQAVLDLSWVQDNIQPAEFESIKDYRWLAQQDAAALQTALQIPWVQDGISDLESPTITEFGWIAKHDAQALGTVLQLPWVQDGIEQIEADAIDGFERIANHDAEALQTALQIPWVQDGITQTEHDIIDGFESIANHDAEALRTLLQTPWVQDGITQTEHDIITRGPSPRAMLFAEWHWDNRARFHSLTVPYIIENDIEMIGQNGLYLMGCTAISVGQTGFYFGLQTDIQRIGWGKVGKGAIFSRWYYNNEPREVRLADTRIPEGGWTESGDYEGNFVSVRGLYDWEAGRYDLRVKGAESDNAGRWFEFWVNDDWIGSLRFPLDDSGKATIRPWCSSTI